MREEVEPELKTVSILGCGGKLWTPEEGGLSIIMASIEGQVLVVAVGCAPRVVDAGKEIDLSS